MTSVPNRTSVPKRFSRRGRRVLLAVTMVGGTAAGVLGTGGVAHGATTDAFGAVAMCTEVAAAVTYSPGLRTTAAKTRHATLNGVISGCSVYGDSFTDTGSLSAALSGKASFDAENWSGTFTLTYPPSAGLSPSVGSLTVTDSGGGESLSGIITSGAFLDAVVSAELVTTSHAGKGTKRSPVTSQLFTSNQPLTVSENVG